MDNKKEEIICNICKEKFKKIHKTNKICSIEIYSKSYKFDSYRSYEKHQWTYHPSNDAERSWAKHASENFINWTGSSYYESFGPYY